MFHHLLPAINDIDFGAPGSPKCIDVICPHLFLEDAEFAALDESLKNMGKPYRLWRCYGHRRDGELELMRSHPSTLVVDPKNDALFIVPVYNKSGSGKPFSADGALGTLFDPERKRNSDGKFYWEKLVSPERIKYIHRLNDEEVTITNCYNTVIVLESDSKLTERPLNYAEEAKDNPKDYLQGFTRYYANWNLVEQRLQQERARREQEKQIKATRKAIKKEDRAKEKDNKAKLAAPGAKELIATLKNELTAYIKKTNPQLKSGVQKYGQHLKFFKTKSRVTNSEANHRLAQKLFDQLDDGGSIEEVFKDIKTLRDDVLKKDMRLTSKQISKLTPGIHSTDLKKIIKKAEKYIQASEQVEPEKGTRKNR